MRKKILLIIGGIILFGIFSYYLAWSFSPGSYSRAETYELNISEKNLIKIINEVKTENDLKTNSFADNKDKHWNSIYFEYKDKKQIIHTLTRPKNKTKTIFYFASYKSKKDLGNWISANKYFWWWKNSQAKTEFEKRILEKIKGKIEFGIYERK